jgi:hypothetical protein
MYGWLLLCLGGVLTVAGGTYWWFWQQRHNAKLVSVQLLQNTDLANNPDYIPSSPGQVKGISTIMETADARPLIVARFLERHDSPLVPHEYFGQVFVDLADQNGFDFRLLPAIAMQESNLCKRIPEGTFNCLGFGIHERGTLAFSSYEANFTRAARELKANYINIGLTTPEKIMRKYTPGSNGSWADSVNQWMSEMKYNDRNKGRAEDTDHSVLEYVVASQSAQPTAGPAAGGAN